jgi:hypothetical protein
LDHDDSLGLGEKIKIGNLLGGEKMTRLFNFSFVQLKKDFPPGRKCQPTSSFIIEDEVADQRKNAQRRDFG